MYEKEINLIDVSFIFLRNLSSQGMCSTGSQNAKNRLQWGDVGVSYVPGYMAQDFWTAGPLAHGSKIPK